MTGKLCVLPSFPLALRADMNKLGVRQIKAGKLDLAEGDNAFANTP